MNTAKYFLHLALVSLFSSCQNLMALENAATQVPQEPIKSTLESQDKKKKPVKTKKSVKKRDGFIYKIIDAPRCPYGSTPVRKMTLKQLNEVYEYTEKYKVDLQLKLNVLERLIALSDNHAGVKIYKLQYADTHFQLNHIDLAAIFYEDFSTLYPGSQESEYALYKAVLCMFELSLESDRDQTSTKKTVLLAKEFLKRSPKIEYQLEVESVLSICHNRLYDHELYVFNFYLKKKNFTSARMRLDFMTKTFDKLISNLDKKVADLAQQLELAMHPVKVNKIKHITKCLG